MEGNVELMVPGSGFRVREGCDGMWDGMYTENVHSRGRL